MTPTDPSDEALSEQQLSIAELIGKSHGQLVQEGRCGPEALRSMGAICLGAGLFKQSKDLLQDSLAGDPDNAEARFHLGWACQALGELDEALDAYQQSLSRKPDQALAHFKRGSVLRMLGRFDEAVADFERACDINPNYDEARFELALLALLRGDTARGFKDYEYRWDEKTRRTITKTDAPLWLGAESLEGKTLLLHEEQGFGDTLQFVRYLPCVAASGARVLLKVQPSLRGLMKASFPEISVFSSWDEVPAHDVHCPLPSLPLACQPRLQGTIPNHVPYLRTDAGKIQRWKQRLGEGRGLRVGLVWAGNSLLKINALRSVELGAFSDILDKARCRFIRLQKDITTEDRHELGSSGRVEGYEEAFVDYSETAALMENLDLVISVDTSTAHLAGALGRPLWVLLPYVPDWRWGLGREDSDWYPSARLFRQEQRGDWTGPLSRMGAELRKLAAR